MVAFNNQENGQPEQSSTDRAMEKIYEEMELIGKERMEKLMSSILEMVSVQLESQMETDDDADEMGVYLTQSEAEGLVWDVHSEFFGI